MIRHRANGEYILFGQNDHAILAGRIAERLSGAVIRRLSPEALRGVAMHDCGWPLHDERPTVNSRGEPLHVFETPVSIGTRVWSESVERAARESDRCGLLVSIHVLHLSGMSAGSHRTAHEQFDLNKFQHRQIEFQETLRPRLGLRVDRPLALGLAPNGTDPAENLLLFEYRVLRAMDLLSLSLLCSETVTDAIDELYPSPGSAPVNLKLSRPSAFTVSVDPWPLDVPELRVEVPCRRVAARGYKSDADLQAAWGQAPQTMMGVRLTSR